MADRYQNRAYSTASTGGRAQQGMPHDHGQGDPLAELSIERGALVIDSQLQRGAEYDAIERAIQDALRGLPSARIRFNWSAIRTGDSRIVVFFVVFALIFVGFTYVLWLFLLSAFD